MKRWVIYILAFAAIVWLNQRKPGGRDLAGMEPVETIRIQTYGNFVQIETDTGRQGVGTCTSAAIQDMKQRADREIFLETAEYLLVHENALSYIDEMGEVLRPSCRICMENGHADLKSVAAYLKTHKLNITMRQFRIKPVQIPELNVVEERMNLVQT